MKESGRPATTGQERVEGMHKPYPEDFEAIVRFHGHVCPGVALGYRAAKIAAALLQADRSEDEELVAIVETDACGVDAFQVLLGCTLGKGNLLFRDYGKQVFTVIPASFQPESSTANRLRKAGFRIKSGMTAWEFCQLSRQPAMSDF